MVGLSAALLVLALSFFAATLFVKEEQIEQTTQRTQELGLAPSPKPADLMSLMQGTKLHLELLSLKDSEGQHHDKEASHSTKDKKGAHHSDKTTHEAEAKIEPSEIELAITSSSSVSSLAKMRQQLHVASLRLAHRMGIKTSSAMTTMLAIVIALVLFAVFCATCPYWINQMANSGSQKNGQSKPDPQTVLEQRERMLVTRASPFNGGRSPIMGNAPMSSQQIFQSPGTGGSLMPAPRNIGDPIGESPRPSYIDQPYRQSVGSKPPPLCPTLVMPMSEALLGIQMYELAQLSAEGELNIVGISGKALLRARIKKMGNQRTLEIAMPEPNSIPRATIQPAAENMSSGLQQGSRALEIRGMRGAFYGILEMRSSGACYVVKDGQTVLTIDGDAESLQLSLKSAVGLQLASVRCSTELFHDVDHVEIRVEPGVDTVLVLSVVLAVLLLSPYLPPTA
jgi:hypothetical protein